MPVLVTPCRDPGSSGRRLVRRNAGRSEWHPRCRAGALRFVCETSDMLRGRRCDLRPRRRRKQLPDGDPSMPRDIVRRAEAVPATSMIALAIGAAAFGALAVGALAIGPPYFSV